LFAILLPLDPDPFFDDFYVLKIIVGFLPQSPIDFFSVDWAHSAYCVARLGADD
jgi:hypothetical protein